MINGMVDLSLLSSERVAESPPAAVLVAEPVNEEMMKTPVELSPVSAG